MMLSAPVGHPTRRRMPRAVACGWALSLLVACGGGATGAGGGGGGGGGGNGAYDPVILQTAAAIGGAMISATVEDGPTLKITMDDVASKGMAKLFLCSNVKGFLKAAGLENTKVVMVQKSGAQLATDGDCLK